VIPENLPGTVILSGITGSQAYGTATAESDIDYKGVFVVPTTEWFRLDVPSDKEMTVHRNGPDITFHEVKKELRLLLSANPTATEMLWLESYEYQDVWGEELVGMRKEFLCKERVLGAWARYAEQQLKDLAITKGRIYDAEDKRRAKHARHLRRLMIQGFELYTTGELRIQVDDPEAYHEFGARVQADPTSADAVKLVADYRERFANARSPLPDWPNRPLAEDWLLRLRKEFS
jgi:predicted nucleotidyltransferase